MSDTEQAIMPDEKGAYSAADLAERYDFSGCQTPEGFDIAPEGYRDAPVGLHIMRLDLAASKMLPEQEFKCDGGSYALNKLQAVFVVTVGPHTGCRTMDFLPMPTRDRIMPKMLANRWANLLHAAGYDLAPGGLVPPGFSLKQLAGRDIQVDVRIQLDAQKQPKLKDDGTKRLGPAFFGYSRPPKGAAGQQQNLPGAVMSGSTPAAKPTPPAPTDDIDI